MRLYYALSNLPTWVKLILIFIVATVLAVLITRHQNTKFQERELKKTMESTNDRLITWAEYSENQL